MSEEDLKTEARIQQEIVMWYRNKYCLKHHHPRCLILSIPNNKNPLMREVGMMAGASDLLVVHNNGSTTNVVFVEIKTPSGRQSPAQIKFEEHIKGMGMDYFIVRSKDEFKRLVDEDH